MSSRSFSVVFVQFVDKYTSFLQRHKWTAAEKRESNAQLQKTHWFASSFNCFVLITRPCLTHRITLILIGYGLFWVCMSIFRLFCTPSIDQYAQCTNSARFSIFEYHGFLLINRFLILNALSFESALLKNRMEDNTCLLNCVCFIYLVYESCEVFWDLFCLTWVWQREVAMDALYRCNQTCLLFLEHQWSWIYRDKR